MAVEELAEVMSRKGVESADGLAQGDECRRLNPVDDRAERAAAGEQEDVCDAVGFAGEECAHEVLDVGDAGGHAEPAGYGTEGVGGDDARVFGE